MLLSKYLRSFHCLLQVIIRPEGGHAREGDGSPDGRDAETRRRRHVDPFGRSTRAEAAGHVQCCVGEVARAESLPLGESGGFGECRGRERGEEGRREADCSPTFHRFENIS